MAKFMLLLYNEPTAWAGLSADEMQKATEKYMAWSQKPYTVDSKRLAEDAGKVVRSNSGKVRTTDGPYSETKEVLGGYYTIEAPDYAAAVKLAEEHPHLAFGTIEVRQVYGK